MRRDVIMQCNRYATESIELACKWAYSGVREGETLSGKLVNLGTQTTTVSTRAAEWIDNPFCRLDRLQTTTSTRGSRSCRGGSRRAGCGWPCSSTGSSARTTATCRRPPPRLDGPGRTRSRARDATRRGYFVTLINLMDSCCVSLIHVNHVRRVLVT